MDTIKVLPPNVVVVGRQNNFVASLVTDLFDRYTCRVRDIRTLLSQLSMCLVCEVVRDLPVGKTTIKDRMDYEFSSPKMVCTIALVPIATAANHMMSGAKALLPDARHYPIITQRDEDTALPDCKLDKFGETSPTDVAFILDPMLATGGTACDTIARVKEWGCRNIYFLACIAAPQGLDAVYRRFPETKVFVAGMGGRLSEEKKWIVEPGIGDAGDLANGFVLRD